MANKKLIEVALPLEKINEESAREKSTNRYGHPSTLHLWWARRPLATTRAVIWSSLVDDPSSHPELFPTEEDQNTERQRLFKILEELVVWENSNDEDILNRAKQEILKYTNGTAPALLDPFAGGGAIPFEAQRLGLKAYANDLNPVAVMINKAMIEIPPRFVGQSPVNPEARRQFGSDMQWSGTKGLAEDVNYYGEWMKQEALKRIGHLYPKVRIPKEQGGGESTVIAWLWARTVKCPNPACGCEMPLANSLEVSKKKGSEAFVKPFLDKESGQVKYEVRYGKCDVQPPKIGKGKFRCVICGEPANPEYIHKEFQEKRNGARLIAVVAEKKNGRFYLSPDADQINSALVERPELEYDPEMNTKCTDLISGRGYGFTHWNELFTNRQLTALSTFYSLLEDVKRLVESDAVKAGLPDAKVSLSADGNGAKAYGEAVAVYLAFAVDKAADAWSSLAGWRNTVGASRTTFARQALPMVWDFAEVNPFSSSCGNWSDACVKWVEKAVGQFADNTVKGTVSQHDAQKDCGLRDIMISTDPPYYDNISYADLSDYFYILMRQSLKGTYPDLFKTMLVPKADELVATSYRFDGNAEKAKVFFEDGMLSACKQMYVYANDDIPVTIYYAYKQSETDDDKTASTGWEAMLSSIINAGFSITGTWPMRTERGGRMIDIGTNALASSIVLVCRKRTDGASQTTRRNLVNTLRRELRPALEKLQLSNIAPVDLAQSAIGPGMGVFSRYSRVLEADGTPMTVRAALQVINEEIDLYFNEQVGDLDTASRFCVDLYTQNAYNDIKYGEAEVLANAKGISIPMMASHGVLYAKAGIVHLIERGKLPEKVDSNEANIWMLTQQLTHAMATGGIEACAKIVFSMFGSNAERAKDLAYRLYTIAEQKKWANEAYAYNSLVVAWPDIQSRAAAMKAVVPQQLSIFDFDGAEE